MSDEKKESFGVTEFVLIAATILIIYFALKVPILKFVYASSAAVFPYFEYLPNPFMTEQMRVQTAGLAEVVKEMNPEDGNLSTLSLFAKVWGYNLMPIALPIFLLICYFGCWQNGGIRQPFMSRYTRQITRDQLAALQSGDFPYALPALRAKVHEQNFWEGPWRIPRDYLEVAIEFGLLDLKGNPWTNHGLSAKAICTDVERRRKFMPHASVLTLNIERADQFHARMLGKPWRGIDAIECRIEKALMVAFMAKAAGPKTMRAQAQDLLREIARTYKEAKGPKGKPTAGAKGIADLYKRVQEIQAKVEFHEDVQSVFNSHAYEITVYAGMLELARKRSGKLSPNTFIWLRPHNLQLFEVLQALGGMAPHPYSSTGFYHYQNEKSLKRAIATPIVEPSTDNLEDELHKERWIVSPRNKVIEEAKRDEDLAKIENNKRLNTQGNSKFPKGVQV